MAQSVFPLLPPHELHPSRDTIHVYSQVLSAVRRALMPPQKHWWHISLRAAAAGLTTTPVPFADLTFEMLLDFTAHEFCLSTSEGDWWNMTLRGQPTHEFTEETLTALRTLGVDVQIERDKFRDKARRAYDTIIVEDYWQAASQVDVLLKQFKGELREETSPVQLWPHHFDLSLVWFSGRLVPGVDAADAEHADEQMAFGFSTGDDGVREPYFYITAYPWQDALFESTLPVGASWHKEGWKGALLSYKALTESAQPKEQLLDFWRTVQKAGAALMQD